MPGYRWATALAFATLLSLVAAAELDTDAIVTLTGAEIVADPGSLPERGYLSTGQPDRAVLETVAAAGFSAVIDLRGADEERGIDERAVVESLGMTYVALPIATPADATFENAAALVEMLAGIDGPVLLHCASGNRVGALFALSAKAGGASSEEALALGQAAGLTRWEEAIREQLGLE